MLGLCRPKFLSSLLVFVMRVCALVCGCVKRTAGGVLKTMKTFTRIFILFSFVVQTRCVKFRGVVCDALLVFWILSLMRCDQRVCLVYSAVCDHDYDVC